MVDLLEHHDTAGVSLDTLGSALVEALEAERFDAGRLRATAETYGSRKTQALVQQAIEKAAVAA